MLTETSLGTEQAERRFRVEPFQEGFYASGARYPAFVAGWGTGKTLIGLLRGVGLSKCYPNNLGLIVRKEFTDLRDSTMKDFEQCTDLTIGSDKNIKFDNGSIIMFRHGAELDVLQNINLGWFLIEQAEEFDTDEQFQMLRGRLRRPAVPHYGMLIANTNGHNWIWRLWKRTTKPSKDYALFEAVTFDNERNLPIDFLADLEMMKTESPHHYNRFVMNSWEELDIEDRVIPYSAIQAAVKHELLKCVPLPVVIGCDPAATGDDETVIYVIDGGKVIESRYYCKKEPMETAGLITSLYRQYKAVLVGIDGDAFGTSIASRLAELGVQAIRIPAAESAGNKQRFKNRKAEIWFSAREMFINREVSIGDEPKLQEQLGSVSYVMHSDTTIELERKEKTKEKLGSSPDRGDALVFGLWALKQAPRPDPDRYDEQYEHELQTAQAYTPRTKF